MGGAHQPFRRHGVGKGTLVQKLLKTASEYAEKGDLFTRIQVKEIITKLYIYYESILKSITIYNNFFNYKLYI